MTDKDIEQEIQARGLTAPRVTPADIEANIVTTEIVKHVTPSGQVLRWAVLTLKNGFAATGAPSCSVSPENDDAEIGEEYAIVNAKETLWPLMGYALKQKLHDGYNPPAPNTEIADLMREDQYMRGDQFTDARVQAAISQVKSGMEDGNQPYSQPMVRSQFGPMGERASSA